MERAAGVSAKIKTYLGGYKNILGRQPREGDVLLRAYFDCGLIDVGVIVTRAEELNDIFK